MQFLDQLKSLIGKDIVHFGRGFRELDDKMDGIYGYRYHLCLENCSSPYYCTEKLIDAYLGWALPLYWGCPNVNEFFPPESIIPIDILNPQKASIVIKDLLAKPANNEEKNRIELARSTVLNKRNPFVFMASLADTYHRRIPNIKIKTILSHKAYRSWFRGLAYRFKSNVINRC